MHRMEIQMQEQNTSAPALFRYDDQTIVRAIPDAFGAGKVGFVLADLCTAVAIANPRNVAARLDDDQKGVRPVDTLGGLQQMTVVSEAGMYEVVLRSDKPEAVAFRRWLTGTVLPEIRKTGQYGAVAQISNRDLARMVIEEADRADKAETRLAVERKHRAAIEGGDGIHLTDFGKKYFSEVPARKFDAHLYGKGWLINQKNTRIRPDGEVRDGVDHRKPTAKGRPYIYGHDQGNYGGKRRFQARVRPQMEIALRDALAAEGLPVNEHSTGLVLITNDEIRELGA
ncbi:hypothetical protein GMA1_36 [Gordonia phage GMA1]|uniref:anti-repressor Ant n=1 Tax=Gordonia phage GMA1 TaxID=1647470 RepID=UPI0007B619D9|nr:anti-repressor Ant [Gordonia phage GMA1]AKJ72133.1 hypothetical protein GMA1_36 [Gordonia phage GMA1]